MKTLSKCGVCCSTDCKAYKTECDGCNEIKGKVAWSKFYGKTLCPIYECVIQKGVLSCDECGKAPCKIWFQTRNPDVSNEEFQADIDSRLNNFKKHK